MGEVTRDDFDKLHSRITEQVEKTATLSADTKANNKRLDKILTLLQGNGRAGLITTVSQQDTKIKSIEKDLDDRTVNARWLASLTVALATCVAAIAGVITAIIF